MRAKRLVVILNMGVAACGHLPALRPEAGAVLVVNEMPTDCRDLGEVSGAGKSGWASLERLHEAARNEIKNRAATRGANYVLVDSVASTTDEVVVAGRALRCPLLVEAPGRDRGR